MNGGQDLCPTVTHLPFYTLPIVKHRAKLFLVLISLCLYLLPVILPVQPNFNVHRSRSKAEERCHGRCVTGWYQQLRTMTTRWRIWRSKWLRNESVRIRHVQGRPDIRYIPQQSQPISTTTIVKAMEPPPTGYNHTWTPIGYVHFYLSSPDQQRNPPPTHCLSPSFACDSSCTSPRP